MSLAAIDERVQAALELDGVLHGSVLRDGLAKPVMMIDADWPPFPAESENASDLRIRDKARMGNW